MPNSASIAAWLLDLALLLAIAALGRDLAIGNGVGLVDQDTQPCRRVHAGLVEALAVVERRANGCDHCQGFPVKPRDGLVEARPNPGGARR